MNKERLIARVQADRARMNRERDSALEAATDAVVEAIGRVISGIKDVPAFADALVSLYDEGYRNGNSDAWREAAQEQAEAERLERQGY